MKHKYLLSIVMLILCNQCIPVFAFDDAKTHRDLTEAAIINNPNPDLKKSLVAFIGYSSGFKKAFQGIDRKGNNRKIEVYKWLQEGSTDEDALNVCRASNHFHNPLFKTTNPASTDWLESQMSDSSYTDFLCGKTNRYSAVTWATGFSSPNANSYIGTRTGKYFIPTGTFVYEPPYIVPAPVESLVDVNQDMGWDNARMYMYDALTAVDPAVREERFVRTFKAVGQVMHMLQDMAVPAHVRNDMTSHLLNGTHLGYWFSNPFEKYVVKHSGAVNIDPNPFKPSFTPPMRHTDFWDKNVYNGANPSDTTTQGLAEYANANFFSEYTVFAARYSNNDKHYFPNPRKEGTDIQSYFDQTKKPESVLSEDGALVKGLWISKIGEGEKIAHLVRVGSLAEFAYTILGESKPFYDAMMHDEIVYKDYANLLLPRAVGYSAALLDYFFRGKISVTAAPIDISFRSIKVYAWNKTPDEAMGAGEARLVIRYKELSEWNMGGNNYQLNYPDNTSPDKYTYKVSTPQNVDLTNQQVLTFDFSADTLPNFYSEMTMQLVFKGKLGNEEGAVAVSEQKPIDGIYSDFTVSLPASGVYAKAADNTSSTLSTTFNELKVNVQTDIPEGLSGGNFELALEYRKATTNPFMSLPVDTEPTNAAAYIIRVPEKNGVNNLQPGIPVELAFDLSSYPLSVTATDVYLNIIYKNTSTKKTMAVGLNDISEPTPVDIFNNTDYACISNIWYPAGSPAAVAASDQAGNKNGIDDDTDIYHHNLTNIYAKVSSIANPVNASPSAFDFFEAGPIAPNTSKRMGFILTDTSFKYSFLPNWVHVDQPQDKWIRTEAATLDTGTAVKNQADSDGNYIYPAMYNMRGRVMWWGGSAIYDNVKLPLNSNCSWGELQ